MQKQDPWMDVQSNMISPTVNATRVARGTIAVCFHKHSTASAHKATIKTTTSLVATRIKQMEERLAKVLCIALRIYNTALRVKT